MEGEAGPGAAEGRKGGRASLAFVRSFANLVSAAPKVSQIGRPPSVGRRSATLAVASAAELG